MKTKSIKQLLKFFRSTPSVMEDYFKEIYQLESPSKVIERIMYDFNIEEINKEYLVYEEADFIIEDNKINVDVVRLINKNIIGTTMSLLVTMTDDKERELLISDLAIETSYEDRNPSELMELLTSVNVSELIKLISESINGNNEVIQVIKEDFVMDQLKFLNQKTITLEEVIINMYYITLDQLLTKPSLYNFLGTEGIELTLQATVGKTNYEKYYLNE